MKRKRRRGNKKSPKIENITQGILKILKSEPNQTFNYKQIASKFGVDDASSRNQIIKKLAQLAAKKEIEEIERGKFKIVRNINTYTGILEITSKGTGYVIVKDLEEDIFIPNNSLNKALNGDEVEVYVYKEDEKAKVKEKFLELSLEKEMNL